MYKNHAKTLLLILLLATLSPASLSQQSQPEFVDYTAISTGAQNLLNSSMEVIMDKQVGIVANQSSLAGREHLVDLLLERGIEITRIFSPEHGFRGEGEAGEEVSDGTDPQTGIPVISLYGNHKKPNSADLEGIDIMLFDLQDVGARFYTYISTLTYVMEACAQRNIPVVVLDRPNPNAFYVDGPVLEPGYTSFVGLHPVPIVYGMTIGEYALMVNGEGWLDGDLQCRLEVIPLTGYRHSMVFELPVRPSPNLPNWKAVLLYPSLCLFEGTIMSVGRGTDYPFQIYGHPEFMLGSYFFLPESRPGASLHPKHEGQGCYGQQLGGYAEAVVKGSSVGSSGIVLTWLLGAYEILSERHDFFNDYFEKLAGTDTLRNQIMQGMTEEEIRASWQGDLEAFLRIRKKYLMYE